MRRPSSIFGLALSAVYLAYAIWTIVQAMNCYAYLCPTIVVYPALPWIFLFGDLYFEDPTPNHVLLFEVLLPLSFILNAFIVYQAGKFTGRLIRRRNSSDRP